MLSTASNYALQAMVCLAGHPGEPLTSNRISELVGIRSEYLAKVLGTLTRAGLVRSRRGRGGGFSLARPPEQVTLLEIVRAIEVLAPSDQVGGRDGDECPGLSALRQLMNRAIEDVEARLESITLADPLKKDRQDAGQPAEPEIQITEIAKLLNSERHGLRDSTLGHT